MDPQIGFETVQQTGHCHTPGGATIRKRKRGEGTLISYFSFTFQSNIRKTQKTMFWRRSPSDLRNLGASVDLQRISNVLTKMMSISKE